MVLQKINIQTCLLLMLEAHNTVTSSARCKVHFILTTFITASPIFVRSDVGVFVLSFVAVLFCFVVGFGSFFNLGEEEALFPRMQKSNLNFSSAGSHVIHLIFLSGFTMKSKAILNW